MIDRVALVGVFFYQSLKQYIFTMYLAFPADHVVYRRYVFFFKAKLYQSTFGQVFRYIVISQEIMRQLNLQM